MENSSEEPMPPGMEDEAATPTKSRAPITVKLAGALRPKSAPLALFEEEVIQRPKRLCFSPGRAPTPNPTPAPIPAPTPTPTPAPTPTPIAAATLALDSDAVPAPKVALAAPAAPAIKTGSRWRSIEEPQAELSDPSEPAVAKAKPAKGVVVVLPKRPAEEQRSKRKSRWGEKPKPANESDEQRESVLEGYEEAFRDPAFQDPAWQDSFLQEPAFQDPSLIDSVLRDPLVNSALKDSTIQEPTRISSRQENIPSDPVPRDPAFQDPAWQDPTWPGSELGGTQQADKTDYDSFDLPPAQPEDLEPEAEKSRQRERDRERSKRDRDKDRDKDHDRGRRDSHRKDDGRKRRSRSRSGERRSGRGDRNDRRDRDRDRDKDRDRGRSGRREHKRERTPERDRDRRRKREDDRKGSRDSPEKRRRRKRSTSVSGRSGSEESRDPRVKLVPDADMQIKEENDAGYPPVARTPVGFDTEQFDVAVAGRLESEQASMVSSSNSPVMGYRRSLADSTTLDTDLQGKRERAVSGPVPLDASRSVEYEEPKAPSRTTNQFDDDDEEDEEEEEEASSPKRISLDDRIEMELGVKRSPPPPSVPGPPSSVPPQYMYPPFPGYSYPGYPTAAPSMPTAASRVVQVGNMLQVVPVETPAVVPLTASVQHTALPHIPLHQQNHAPAVSTRKVVPCAAPAGAQAGSVPVVSPGLVPSPVSGPSPVKRAVASPPPAPLPVPVPAPTPAPTVTSTPAIPSTPAPLQAPVPVPVPAPAPVVPQSSLAAAAAAVAAAIAANSPIESAKDETVTHLSQSKSITELPFLPPDLVSAMEEERMNKRKERELRRKQREERRKQKELRRQQKIQRAAELYKKSKKSKTLLQEGQLLRSDFEAEEMRLIEEAMMNSDLAEGNEENYADAAAPAEDKARKRLKPVPLPPAGKGILISPGFRDKPISDENNSGSPLPPKEVKFADGVKPGDGTSPSGGEEISSPPPPEKVQKKKVVKKKKMKKKIKVQVVRTLPLEDEDDDDDDSSPPPPPPGSPPPSAYPPGTFPGYASGTAAYAYATPTFPGVTGASPAMFQQYAQSHQLPPPPPVVPPSVKK